MAENNQICEKCGADVRSNAAFCFNCGSQVVPDEMVETVNERDVSNAWFKETIAETRLEPEPVKEPIKPAKTGKTNKLDKTIAESKPVVNPTVPITKIDSAPAIETPPAKTEATPKAVAAMRDKPKLSPYRTVQVRWEEPQSPSNIWFLTVALISLILAVGLIALMLYLR